MNRDMNQNERRNDRGRRPGREQNPPQMPQMEGRPMTPPPGFVPPGRGMEGRPMTPPPGFIPPGQGMEGQPRSAPPNFIPERPDREMERGQMRGPGFNYQFYPGNPFGRRDLRRCVNSFTFIWLFNGNSFWFYPTFVDRQFVQGFRWRRNGWEFDRINVNRIAFFRCF